MLSKALNDGCVNAVLEVTSHGLDQYRTYGFDWDVCGFTNLTQDHLDYHSDMSAYADAKKKLFFEELESSKKPKKGAVVNADNMTGQEILSSLSLNKNISRLSFSAENKEESLFQSTFILGEFDSTLSLSFKNDKFSITTPLLGAFNYENLRCAVGILLGLGYSPKEISDAGKYVESVPGRIELVSKSLPRVFVDYAHTPDALDKIQDVLREMLTEGERLITVFGCGGDRDSKKRPLMGRSVAERSDVVIVTSDNPRTEDPERIIAEIIKGIVNIDVIREVDRKIAIEKAINLADRNDIVLIAGKGHEDYQIIGHEKKFFCDRTFAKEFIDKRGL
jgi:UDP-N-acetylmuramoyl-L-alanyl-D-glutamate--2,6-diaminopimelate ligase